MRFEKDSKVTHPARVVVETMMDRMDEILPHLGAVESIQTISRETLADGREHIVRRWQGTADSAPAAVRPFLSREALAWTDDAVWSPGEFKVDWTLSTKLSKLYTCGGTNYFLPHPDDPDNATLIRITGDLVVQPDKLPGVPTLIGRKLAPQVEKFVVNLISPNLTETARGIQAYLDERRKAG